MFRRKLLPVLLSASVLFVIANLLVLEWSNRMPFKKVMSMVRSAKDPNMLLMGNSIMAGRVNIDQFRSLSQQLHSDLRPVNVAIGATGPSEHQLLFDYSLSTQPQLQTLVLGFDDVMLTSEIKTPPDQLLGNQLVGTDPSIPFDDVSDAYQLTWFESAEFQFLRLCPLAAYRSNAWRDVELLRRKLGSIGMPAIKETSLGRVQDFEAMDAATAMYFAPETAKFNADPTHFNPDYEHIFAHAQNHGMKIVLVEMPISERHRATYYSQPVWKLYIAKLHELALRRGFTFIDASDWVNGEENFEDPLHMSPAGAQVFTKRLAEELAKNS